MLIWREKCENLEQMEQKSSGTYGSPQGAFRIWEACYASPYYRRWDACHKNNGNWGFVAQKQRRQHHKDDLSSWFCVCCFATSKMVESQVVGRRNRRKGTQKINVFCAHQCPETCLCYVRRCNFLSTKPTLGDRKLGGGRKSNIYGTRSVVEICVPSCQMEM